MSVQSRNWCLILNISTEEDIYESSEFVAYWINNDLKKNQSELVTLYKENS